MFENENEFKNLVTNLNIDDSPSDTHRQTLRRKMLSTFNAKTDSPAPNRQVLRKIIMKKNITKLAAAAVIIIAVLIGVNHFGGSIDVASIAWADVQTAFIDQPWVHVKYDNGREEWHNLHEGKVFYKDENNNGLCRVKDMVSETSHMYFTGFDHIIEHTSKSTRKKDKAFHWQPLTTWEAIVDNLGHHNHSDVEKHFDIINGKEFILFDRYFTDAFDKRVLIQQLWADQTTHLPVRIRKKLTANESRQQNRKYITGNFDFPQTGPSTIYDIGAPVHLKIVNARKQKESTSFEINEIIKASAKASENFPSKYLSIIWESETSSGEVAVIYRNGHKINVSRYSYDIMSPIKSPDSPLTTDEVLRWTQTQEPSTIFVFDEEKEYWRRNASSFGYGSNRQPEVHVHRTEWPIIRVQSWYRLENRFWPHFRWVVSRRTEIINDHPDSPADSITISTGDKYFFVDPKKDYLCLGVIAMKIQDDQANKQSETWWSDFSQLPTGHWYPTRERFTSFPNPEQGTSGHEQCWNFDIQLLEEDEFPPDIFNGEMLLEGAKIETY